MYGKCSKISNTLKGRWLSELQLTMIVRKANREDPDQTSSEAVLPEGVQL